MTDPKEQKPAPGDQTDVRPPPGGEGNSSGSGTGPQASTSGAGAAPATSQETGAPEPPMYATEPGSEPGAPQAQNDADRIAALSAELAAVRAELEAAQRKASEHYEQMLRAAAEMENVRRRAAEDVAKAHKFAVESFAESMLPVRDSLEMALSVETPSIASLREGVEATLRQLSQAFERNKLFVIDPLHQKFDPNHHQAISMVPSSDVPANHVVTVLQKGYLINDRVLRPALVTVSQGA